MHRPIVDVAARSRSVPLLLVRNEVLDAGLSSESRSLHSFDGLVGSLSREVGAGKGRVEKYRQNASRTNDQREEKKTHSPPKPSQFRPPSATLPMLVIGPRAMLTPLPRNSSPRASPRARMSSRSKVEAALIPAGYRTRRKGKKIQLWDPNVSRRMNVISLVVWMREVEEDASRIEKRETYEGGDEIGCGGTEVSFRSWEV